MVFKTDQRFKLTAAIMTKNSMATLPKCIESLSFCDEIVVMDDFSEDGTWEYVQSLGERFICVQRKLDTFSKQRQAMTSYARTDWVLIVDADEEALHGLGDEIIALLGDNPTAPAYHVPQKNILPGHWPKPIHFWTSQKRLLNLRFVHWADSEWIHVPAIHPGRAGRLRHGLKHYSYDSMMHMLRKQLYYGESGGRHFHKKGKKASLAGMWIRMVTVFIKHYVFKGLFRFGFGGFSVAFATSFYVFSKYSFLWEKNHGKPAHERAVVPGEHERPG